MEERDLAYSGLTAAISRHSGRTPLPVQRSDDQSPWPIALCGYSLREPQVCPRRPRSVIAEVVLWTDEWFAGLAGLTAEDRLYNCLPMHHSVGEEVVAISSPLVFGGPSP